MKVVIQRVLNSSVLIDSNEEKHIDKGLMILLGMTYNDSSDDIKYLVLEDMVSLNGFVYLRDNDKKEDYEYFRNQYKQLVNEAFPDKVEGLLDNYLSIELEDRNFQAFMKSVEMNILLEMYETFAGRVK